MSFVPCRALLGIVAGMMVDSWRMPSSDHCAQRERDEARVYCSQLVVSSRRQSPPAKVAMGGSHGEDLDMRLDRFPNAPTR